MSVGGWGWGVAFIQILSGLWPGRVSGWGWGCDLDSVHSDTVGVVAWVSQVWVGLINDLLPPPTHTHSLPSGSMILTESVQVISSSG